MLLMFSLPLRHSLRLRRCLHRIVLYSLGSHFTIVCTDIPLDSMIALLHYYMVWLLQPILPLAQCVIQVISVTITPLVMSHDREGARRTAKLIPL
jgi:hypothetical protein